MMVKTLVAGAALAVASGFSYAGTAVKNQFFTGFQQLSDNSAEYQSVDVNGDGLLGVGDVLRGIFTIETIEQGANKNFLGIPGINELTGLFEIEVTKAVRQTQLNGANAAGDWLFTFAPTAAFVASYGAGAMIATWDDATLDFARTGCATIAACEATATGGTPFAVLGFGDVEDFWVAQAVTNNIGDIGSIPAPQNGGTFNVGLSVLSQGAASSGLNFGLVDCPTLATVGTDIDLGGGNTLTSNANVPVIPGAKSQVCGSGSLLGTGGVTTPYDSFDNVDFAVNIEVPEPTSLALVGLALFGLAAVSRQRKA